MSVTIRALAAAAALLISTPSFSQAIDPAVQKRIDRILKRTPVIDGHNDVPEQVRENWNMSVEGLASGTDKRQPHPMMTDMERLHEGGVGGQFWSV